jgi:hypothetical protein
VSEPPPGFQWLFNGVAIKGATNSMLILAQISDQNAGNYEVLVSNPSGSIASHTAAVTLPSLSSSPAVRAHPGVYDGLFYQTNTAGDAVVKETSTGFLSNCTIGTNGAYSARLVQGGNSFAFSGVWNLTGEISTVVNRNSVGLSNLTFIAYSDLAFGTGRLTGIVSNMDSGNPWVAILDAGLTTNTFSPAADFLFLSPPPAGQPAGTWTCQLSITSAGSVLLAGQLGDGTAIFQSGFVGSDGSFPVYQSLYNNTGVLAGWITFAGGAPIGDLTWIQLANPAQSTQGFTNVVSFGASQGSSTNLFQLIQ